ncbi:MAG: fused MFS/spermidine synthase [Vicinamibacterales bacterium]|nr:fused MFS/spermidine synthase [Vicinamibacterales bacterium]
MTPPASAPPASRTPAWLLPLLVLLFFGSGTAALIYQVMWLRLLGLVFGVTVYAASTVLASFMAGLAIGSYAAGRVADRARHPLRLFGLAEIAVGLSALATPHLLDALQQLWVRVAPALPESLAVMTAVRFACAFAVLIVPAALMGATLPLVVKSAISRLDGFGARVGLLYATNTAGAILGAVTAGFYLISELGVTASFTIAALINGAIGLAAIAASYAIAAPAPAASGVPAEPRLSGWQTVVRAEADQRTVLWVFALSGLVTLALEVVWFRILAIFLRPTAYAFTIMLAAVLVGLALGSYLITPWLRRRANWLAVLTVMQLGIALTAALSFNWLARSQAALEVAAPWLARTGLDPYLGPLLVASLVSILPATLLLGMAFPIGLQIWAGAGDPATTSTRVGLFYSLNVCGAILGSVLGGFVFLPIAGSHGSLLLVSAIALLSSVALAWQLRSSAPRFARVMLVGGPAAFGLVAVAAVNPLDLAFERFHRGESLLWRQEGVQTTVAIHERPTAEGPQRIMYLDGRHQANDSPVMAGVHHRIGALPMMLHANPERALVIGMGGGATPGAVAQFPGVEVDVVELSAEVARGARYFDHINFGLLTRPNVRLRVDDGRNFLMTQRRAYDVITADIILPRHAGAGSLYSREYFLLVRDALRHNGIALQWNGAETEIEYKLIKRTFLEVFPYTTLWVDGTLMVGSVTPFTFSRRAFERRQETRGYGGYFTWDYDRLASLYLAGPNELRTFVGDGPVLTDDKPRLEYFLSLPKDAAPVDVRGLTGTPADVLRP